MAAAEKCCRLASKHEASVRACPYASACASCWSIVHLRLFVQTINLLIVNQSLIDMCASLVMLLTAVVTVDGTRMSRDRL